VAFDLVNRPELETSPFAEVVNASPDYLETMGIRILEGRGLVTADTQPGGGAIISDSLARTFWPGRSPIGARFNASYERIPRVLVGVANDVRGTALDGRQYPQLYLPFTDSREATIVVRTALPPGAAFAQLRAAVKRVDQSQVVFGEATMEDVAAGALAGRRAAGLLATVFGMITLLLAALGLYGLLALGVAQQLPELGIRFALGARRTLVVRGVVRDSLLLAAIGATLGLSGALLAARFLRSQLYGVTTTDPLVYIAVPAAILVIALLAAIIPAVRAALADPMRVLRVD
jgi:hypothetical protein